MNDELQRCTGLEPGPIVSLCRRVAEAVAQQGLPGGGEDLSRAIAVRDKELTQDYVTRQIIEYAGLTDARDRLVRVRDEGEPVDDLPAGMTIQEALENIEARIVEADRYVIAMEDGYLVQRLAQMPAIGEGTGASA